MLALIAARLDALPRDQRALLLDAAVVGDVFWPDVLAAVGEWDMSTVESSLAALEDREFVRRVDSTEGHTGASYAFWHALTRDVAYESLPRAVRAAKHAAAADRLEADCRDLALADVLADHRIAAIELARAAGDEGLAGRQREPAIRALVLAGDRMLPLDVVAAETRYARAADLSAPADPGRALVLRKWGSALTHSGRFEPAIAALQEAVDLSTAEGDVRRTALAVVEFSRALYLMGDTSTAVRLHHRWLPVLKADGPSPESLALVDRGSGSVGSPATSTPAAPHRSTHSRSPPNSDCPSRWKRCSLAPTAAAVWVTRAAWRTIAEAWTRRCCRKGRARSAWPITTTVRISPSSRVRARRSRCGERDSRSRRSETIWRYRSPCATASRMTSGSAVNGMQ